MTDAGIAALIALASLLLGSITFGADVSTPAERGDSIQLTAPPAPPNTAPALPTPGPTGTTAEGRCTQYEPLLREHAPPIGWDVAHFSRIMWRESRCTPDVRSRTSDTGLLQINDINHSFLRQRLGEHVDRWTLTDPTQNIRAAAALCVYWHNSGHGCTHPWKATR